jgi:hypothetical protein
MSDDEIEEPEIIQPINRLKNKVAASSGASGSAPGRFDPRKLAAAQGVVDAKRPPYHEHTESALNELVVFCAAAEAVPQDQRKPHIKRIASIAADIKSLGSTFGYPLMTQIGESLRDYCNDLLTPSSEQLTVIRAHIDAMRAVVKGRISGGGGKIGVQLMRTLVRAVEKFKLD